MTKTLLSLFAFILSSSLFSFTYFEQNFPLAHYKADQNFATDSVLGGTLTFGIDPNLVLGLDFDVPTGMKIGFVLDELNYLPDEEYDADFDSDTASLYAFICSTNKENRIPLSINDTFFVADYSDCSLFLDSNMPITTSFHIVVAGTPSIAGELYDCDIQQQLTVGGEPTLFFQGTGNKCTVGVDEYVYHLGHFKKGIEYEHTVMYKTHNTSFHDQSQSGILVDLPTGMEVVMVLDSADTGFSYTYTYNSDYTDPISLNVGDTIHFQENGTIYTNNGSLENDDTYLYFRVIIKGTPLIGAESYDCLIQELFVAGCCLDLGLNGYESSQQCITDIVDNIEMEEKKINFTVFPNPINNEFQINSDQEIHSAKLLSLDGHIIKSFDGSSKIQTNGINPGIYILKIHTAQGIATEKIEIL